MLKKLRTLIEKFNRNGVRYCHWKSNLALAKALEGQTDVDLLIHRQDANLFNTILSQLGFRTAVNRDPFAFPSVVHSFALDEDSGAFVHVHAYFRVITGESLSKNYHLPIEEMLLHQTRELDSLRLPTKNAELVIFTLRILLKHTSLVELVMLARDWNEVKEEAQWLLENNILDETLRLVHKWLPALDVNLFSECLAALQSSAPLWRRILLGHRLRSQLRCYTRHSALRVWLDGMWKFIFMFCRRLTRSPKGLALQSGGAVIAFVGPEATGKSTLLAETNKWLGEYFALEQVHAGKPKSTLVTIIPNLFLPLLRRLLPTSRSVHVETHYPSQEQAVGSKKSYPLVFALRSALLGWDRRTLLTHAFRLAANGTIVLCDRYPSLRGGAPDSPQLSHLPIAEDGLSLRRPLARLEKRFCDQIPPPDLIISLTVPVEVAVLRNKTRGKYEPEDFVRLRHAQSTNLDFGNTQVYKINTDQPLNKVVLELKNWIWNAL